MTTTNQRSRRTGSLGRRLLVLLLALGFVTSACTNGGADDARLLPQDSEFFNPDGSASSLADYEGQAIVLNFFASWCPPCRAELPEFQSVSLQVAPDVTFLGVNTDFQQDAWLQLIEDTGVTYPTVFQPSNELYTATKSPSMPTTVFIGADGAVREIFAGQLSEERLLELIDEHLRT